MKTAAVSELKASLSAYLEKVKAGEELLVTARGKPVAKIIPVSRKEGDYPPHLLALERAGTVKIGHGKLPKEFWSLVSPKDPKGRALAALLKERDEAR
jgi:prevent-host-death family protein